MTIRTLVRTCILFSDDWLKILFSLVYLFSNATGDNLLALGYTLLVRCIGVLVLILLILLKYPAPALTMI